MRSWRIPLTGLFLMFCVGVSGAALEWRWPGTSPGPSRLGESLFSTQIRGAAAGEGVLRYRFAAAGEVVYRTAPPGAEGSVMGPVPKLLVVVHPEQFWTVYWGIDGHPQPEGGPSISFDDTFTAPGPVAFETYDGRRGRVVNPRALLPDPGTGFADGMPPISVRQNEVYRPNGRVQPGSVSIGVRAVDLVANTLPRRLYVLSEGLLVADLHFDTPEDLRARRLEDGFFEIFSDQVDPGTQLYEIEAVLYDGTVERRRLRVFVAAPTNSEGLDTR